MRSFLRSAIKPQRPIGQVVCPPQLKQPVCSCIQSSDSWQPAPTLSTTAIKEQTAMRSISTAAQHKRGYISTLNVSEAFDKAASENAQKPVCVFNDGLSRTFSEFHQDVAAFAGGLQQLNLSKHARIAIFAPTCYEWLVAKYAINRAGCVVVAMNSTAPKEETGHVLEKTETEAVIIGETFKYVDCYQIICDIFPELKSSGVLNAKRKLKHVISTTVERKPGTITLRELQSAGPTSATRMKLDDPAVIMQSSGSTGKPKSIVLSNGNVVSAAYQNFTAMRLRHSNVVMACLPLYHSFGYLCIEANNTLNGLTTVYTSTKPKPAEILEMMERQRVTTVHGTPTTFFDILNCSSFGRRDLSTVQNGTIGATTLHASVIQNVIEKLRLKDLMLGYGLTETSGACSFADGTNFRGYKPFPGTEFRIAKSAEEMTLDDQQARGEIQIRGATLFLEYLNDDVKTRATFTDDGWFRTNDIGHMNEHGLLEICGRGSDLIIKGGVNISPVEIETTLLQHPAIAEAHVTGVSDERFGEEICAWIKLQSGGVLSNSMVTRHCANKLANIKIPKHIVFTDDFPRTSVGKVSKKLLKEVFERDCIQV